MNKEDGRKKQPFNEIDTECLDYIVNELKNNKSLQQMLNYYKGKYYSDRYWELKKQVDAVIDDLKHFHLIYNEDGKLILSGESILTEIRYFIDKLEGTIPIDMTPFEHEIWEKENR